MNIKTKFDIGQTVVLKHDREKSERMVTGLSARKENLISYNLMRGIEDSWHWEMEIEIKKEESKTGFIK